MALLVRGMVSYVQSVNPYILATLPRDASARNGGERAWTAPWAGCPAATHAGAPCNAARYLLKQKVLTTAGIALRANLGSTVTQQVVCNVLTVMEQMQTLAQVYFPGTGSPVQRQHDVERHFIGSEAGNGGQEDEGLRELGDPVGPVSGSSS